MQNKGFVKVFAVLLTLVCVFYMSFSAITSSHMIPLDSSTISIQ